MPHIIFESWILVWVKTWELKGACIDSASIIGFLHPDIYDTILAHEDDLGIVYGRAMQASSPLARHHFLF